VSTRTITGTRKGNLKDSEGVPTWQECSSGNLNSALQSLITEASEAERDRMAHPRLTGSWPRAKLVIQCGENPLLQNSSKVGLQVLKYQTDAQGANIED
jgi:hypothetical protein